ncbi:MAG TPA: zinc ABC transporter substrate-binding protein [Methanoregulaceae archaeon]|nr:zinc ABC transporter substrate-binding protein [Methanoregulaceae archaeon]HNO07690.1 zinc ABC transporter substrate-binding protein [Methanoregulaceae archaeon]HPS23378.1 zinc ABC transporter substrate-binding protein [Methanoregulaceae archaeon]
MIPRSGVITLALVLLVLAAGCNDIARNAPGERISVAVTIPPQEEMVREIGGERVEVVVMVPPGSDPHTYEPEPALVARAAGADLYVTIGTGLLPIEDTLVSRLKAMNPDLVVADSSKGVVYLYPDNGEGPSVTQGEYPGKDASRGNSGPDPHIWLSLRNAVIMSENTRDALIKVDPANENEYRRNCDKYTSRLRDLDQEIDAAYSRNDPGMILVTHQAWDYFARDYHLDIVAIENDGKEATAKDLASFILLARSHGIRVVFAEAQESTREAETIAGEIGGSVRVIDPLAGDYLANMERVAEAFGGAAQG